MRRVHRVLSGIVAAGTAIAGLLVPIGSASGGTGVTIGLSASRLANGQSLTVTVGNVPDGVSAVQVGICRLVSPACSYMGTFGGGASQFAGVALVAVVSNSATATFAVNEGPVGFAYPSKFCDNHTNGTCGVQVYGLDGSLDQLAYMGLVGFLGQAPVTFVDDWGVTKVKTTTTATIVPQGHAFTLHAVVTADDRPYGVPAGLLVQLVKMDPTPRYPHYINVGLPRAVGSYGKIAYHLYGLSHTEWYWVKVWCWRVHHTYAPTTSAPAGLDIYAQRLGSHTYESWPNSSNRITIKP